MEEFYRQLAKAQRHLRINDDNRNYVASRATDALNAVVSVVSARCSLASAKASLKELNDILHWAEDLSSYANLNPAGIYALWHVEHQSLDQAEISWKHVESLANQRANPDLHVPSGSRLLLALHVLEDAGKQNEARALAQRVSRYHASVARLKSRVADSARFPQGTVASELDEYARCLCQHSLGDIRLCELPELEQGLTHAADLLRVAASKTSNGFSADAFGSDALKLRDLQNLAILADGPVEFLQMLLPLSCSKSQRMARRTLLHASEGIPIPQRHCTPSATTFSHTKPVFRNHAVGFRELIAANLSRSISLNRNVKRHGRSTSLDSTTRR